MSSLLLVPDTCTLFVYVLLSELIEAVFNNIIPRGRVGYEMVNSQ